MTEFGTCTAEDVRQAILKSPVKSSTLDPIPTFLLRELLEDLLPFITLLCRRSMSEGFIPSQMKVAVVTPVLKQSNFAMILLALGRYRIYLSFLS